VGGGGEVFGRVYREYRAPLWLYCRDLGFLKEGDIKIRIRESKTPHLYVVQGKICYNAGVEFMNIP
jgi:hypothetical protein